MRRFKDIYLFIPVDLFEKIGARDSIEAIS